MDTIFQALSGLMQMSGSEGDTPVRSGVPFGDLTGPLFAVIGTLSALLLRERTGRGQHVDVSLLGALTALAATEPWRHDGAGRHRDAHGQHRCRGWRRLASSRRSTDTSHSVRRAMRSQRGVFEALGRPELADDERYSHAR